MNIILVLIPLSVILIIAAIAAFFWAVNNDQFDDMDAAALDVLGDDSEPLPKPHQELENAADSMSEPADPSDKGSESGTEGSSPSEDGRTG